MSETVGEFTTFTGETRLPLPAREAGSSGGAGGPAGHAVCGADWAFLLEALAERHSHGYVETSAAFNAPLSFDVRPHAVEYKIGGYGSVMYFHHGIACTLAQQMAGSTYRLFLDPDWAPPTTLATAATGMWDGGWSTGSGVFDHRLVLAQRDMGRTPTAYYPFDAANEWHETQYSQGAAAKISGAFPKHVDDVRRMYYDLKRMRRRLCVVACERDRPSAYYESTYSTTDGRRHESSYAPSYYALGPSVLNVRTQTAPTVANPGFCIIQAHAWHQRWTGRDTANPVIEFTETADAWFAARCSIGGAVDLSEWTPAKLKSWAESLFEIRAQDDYSADAVVWGDGGLSAADSWTRAYFDLSFPIDAQAFGGSYDRWSWTPPATV